MKRLMAILGLVFGTILAAPLSVSAAAIVVVPNCTPTGFIRDGINLTASYINPGNVIAKNINAAGCNIGVYYGPGQTGNIIASQIYGANYFGVVNNGAKVNISSSQIHDIGETPFNGTQHGVGIYYVYGSNASGNITSNTVTRYQKGGIVVNGAGASATIAGNTVIGLGQVNFIAQNGIQLGYGAHGSITGNTVSGNAYTGANNAFSAGILVFGGCDDPMITNTMISGNTATNNDVAIYVVNTPVDNCVNAPATATNNSIIGNIISNNAVSNISGFGGGKGYQAGITEYGNGDKIIGNTISGLGYQSQNNASRVIMPIDTTGTINVLLLGNTIF